MVVGWTGKGLVVGVLPELKSFQHIHVVLGDANSTHIRGSGGGGKHMKHFTHVGSAPAASEWHNHNFLYPAAM